MTNTELLSASKIMIGSLLVSAVYLGSLRLWSGLPYDAELTYLLANGTLYVDTGIYNAANVKVDSKMSGLGIDVLNGSELNTSAKFKWGIGGLRNPYIGYGTTNNNYNYQVAVSIDDIYLYHLERGLLTISNKNNVVLSSTTATMSTYSSYPIYLFRMNRAGQLTTTNGSIRIYYCNITVGDVVHEFIPVRVGSVGYMYDKQTKLLFGNLGTGSFTLGPDKVSMEQNYTKLEYIESTADGGLYIDLDVKLYETLGTNYDVAIKFNIFGKGKNNTTNAAIFACLDPVNPWPGTFIRKSGNSTDVVGRYIGANIKDNTLGSINQVIELPVKTPPEKNVYDLNNSSNLTHSYGTSLFCVFSNTNNDPKDFTHARLYYFKLFVEGVLIRDMIPCKNNTTNAIGLYDKVNDVFYTSPNGAVFVAGPEILS